MTAERLPPEGYELGPGWREAMQAAPHDGLPFRHARAAIGAIVRKAEAPTACDVCGDPEPHVRMVGECFTRTEEGKREAFPEVPPEQPSGNAGRLGNRPTCDTPGCGRPIPVGGEGHPEICPTCLAAEAPAAPVGETGEEACARLGIDVRQWAAEVRAKVAAAMPMPAAVVLEVVIKAMTVNFGQVYDGPSVCAENYGLVDRLRGIYKNPGGERRFAVAPIHKEAADRISALEAEVAARLVERDGWMEAAAKSEREKAALQAELAEATSHVNDVAEAYRRTLAAWEAKYVESFTMLAEANAACVAAVQAERERCAATLDEWLAGRIERLSECRQRIGDGTPIKNGDRAP